MKTVAVKPTTPKDRADLDDYIRDLEKYLRPCDDALSDAYLELLVDGLREAKQL